MKIDTYYDVCCTRCGAHRSTDFNKGMPMSKRELKLAVKEGWTYSKAANANYCPNCSKANPTSAE